MPSGGARLGAGRPKGSRNRVTGDLQPLIASKQGLSPGRVFLEEMWFHYGRAARVQGSAQANTPEGEELIAKYLKEARAAGEAAAPYVHTRLSSVVLTGDEDGGPVTIDATTAIVGVAGILTAADLAKLDPGELAQLYREKIAAIRVPDSKPQPDSA